MSEWSEVAVGHSGSAPGVTGWLQQCLSLSLSLSANHMSVSERERFHGLLTPGCPESSGPLHSPFIGCNVNQTIGERKKDLKMAIEDNM